ncbi:hypothetical protein E4U47_000483 [Claviceps purpurea]|nr:hypothetical protein E4U47_000483 [Claviceps purpurea]
MSATEEQTMSRGDERDARNRARVSSEAWCRGRDASTSFLRSSQESKEPGSPEAPMKQRRDGKLQRAANYGCKARIRRGGFARVCRLREQENKSAWDRSGSQTWSWPEMVKEGACELKTGLRTGGRRRQRQDVRGFRALPEWGESLERTNGSDHYGDRTGQQRLSVGTPSHGKLQPGRLSPDSCPF